MFNHICLHAFFSLSIRLDQPYYLPSYIIPPMQDHIHGSIQLNEVLYNYPRKFLLLRGGTSSPLSNTHAFLYQPTVIKYK